MLLGPSDICRVMDMHFGRLRATRRRGRRADGTDAGLLQQRQTRPPRGVVRFDAFLAGLPA